MAINEIICLRVFVLTRKFVKILFRPIPSVIIMYITGILEEMEWQFCKLIDQVALIHCAEKLYLA